MAKPEDFYRLRLTCRDEQRARAQMRKAFGRNWWRVAGRAAWAGFAAELAMVRAFNAADAAHTSTTVRAELADTLSWDLTLRGEDGKAFRVEVKSRAVARGRGWTNPQGFDYIVVPTHQGREPIKPQADVVWFAWYAADEPRHLWVLGQVHGVDEFKRRAVFYPQGEHVPRWGEAPAGGAWSIEVKQLRPLPAGLFAEDRK